MFCHPYSITIFIRIERKDREIKWGKKDEEAEREREKGREREEERWGVVSAGGERSLRATGRN